MIQVLRFKMTAHALVYPLVLVNSVLLQQLLLVGHVQIHLGGMILQIGLVLCISKKLKVVALTGVVIKIQLLHVVFVAVEQLQEEQLQLHGL